MYWSEISIFIIFCKKSNSLLRTSDKFKVDNLLHFVYCHRRRAKYAFVGLQPTVIASRAPHLLLEQSVKIRTIVDVRRPSKYAYAFNTSPVKMKFVTHIASQFKLHCFATVSCIPRL